MFAVIRFRRALLDTDTAVGWYGSTVKSANIIVILLENLFYAVSEFAGRRATASTIFQICARHPNTAPQCRSKEIADGTWTYTNKSVCGEI